MTIRVSKRRTLKPTWNKKIRHTKIIMMEWGECNLKLSHIIRVTRKSRELYLHLTLSNTTRNQTQFMLLWVRRCKTVNTKVTLSYQLSLNKVIIQNWRNKTQVAIQILAKNTSKAFILISRSHRKSRRPNLNHLCISQKVRRDVFSMK